MKDGKSRKKLYAGVAIVLGISIVPLGAMAHQHENGGAGSAGMKPAPMGAPAPHGMPGGDHMAGGHAMEGDHAAAGDHATWPAPAMKKKADHHKKDTGSTEGGGGSGDNPGGSIVGDDAAPAHPHGPNQGGDIH